jgi:hypothetical protein
VSISVEHDSREILWHYTDAAGLFGILSSRQLRFGDARFLNDRTERVYGSEFVEGVLTELEANDASGMVREVRAELAFRKIDRLYVCSFCETHNSMSQWQRYGADGYGYCIGFDAAQLDTALDPERAPRVAMIYDPAEQRQLVIEAATGAAEMYTDFTDAVGPQRDGVFVALPAPGDLTMVMLRLKNPDFRDEHEWRYFVEGYDWADDGAQEEDFAVRGAYIKPFIELPRKLKYHPLKPLPVTNVVCGPRLDGEIAVPAVERFLRSRGYENITVEVSPLAKSWR